MESQRWEERKTQLSEESVKRYKQEGYWSDQSFIDIVECAFQEYPQQKLVGPNRRTTYEELDTEVQAVAASLQNLGIEPGDVVSYQLPNWITATAVHLAISRVGAVANPITPIYRETELEYILRNSGSKCIFIPDEYRDMDYPAMVGKIVNDLPAFEHIVVVGKAPERVGNIPAITYDDMRTTDGSPSNLTLSANDVHVILYTSGTTSDPKGVLHTHNTLLAEERQSVNILGLSNETTVFMPSPIGHITGLCYGIEMPFLEGMKVVYMDRWDPEAAVDLIDREGCNVTMAATPFLRDLTQAAPKNWNTSLRVFSSGGAEVPPNLVYEATEKLNCKVHRMYGLTEISTVTWPPLDADTDICAKTDGPPAPGVRVKIVDEETREEVPPGGTGELLAYGPELMIGYIDDEMNEKAFEGAWFKTGDLASIENGYIEIKGRLKDVIIRGGETISVKEVEDHLESHPAISNAAVIAMPDPDLGETGCAYVQVAEGESFTFEEMVQYIRDSGIAKQKTPERLEIVSKFPKTSSGKIEKAVLRADIRDKLDIDP